ncbi:MAG TPA: rhomboid family intramembrane serine protease [Promineifilum sp.]|nr:rhomboid family intramembrane serine protease [Promineifilum sp.]HQF69798.1 rhomboid family intramembrane serine protease [Promineifilum sp.]
MNTAEQTLRSAGTQTKRLLRPLLIILALMWIIEIADWLLFNGALDQFGIIPRQLVGLRGIPIAPLLHGSFSHLAANTIPFLALGLLVMLRHSRQFTAVSIIIVLVSGLGTWLFAPAYTIHIGASGLIFGYFAFLVVAAFYERSPGAIGLALLVIVFYGGLLWGAMPQDGAISWQGHLFGLVGGGLAAYAVAPRRIRIRIDPN